MTSLSKFLSKNKLSQLKFNKPIIPETIVKVSNVKWDSKIKYSNADDFYKANSKRTTNKLLPIDKTEIKGLPQEAMEFFYTHMKPFSIPLVLRNEFLTVRFIPSENPLNQFKKSTISIIFNFAQCSELNDDRLYNGKKMYSGKFRYLDWFNAKIKPTQSAPGRNGIRRMYKKLFINALNRVKTGKRNGTIGIYQFTVLKYPVNSEECEIVEKEFIKMMNSNRTLDLKTVPTKQWDSLSKEIKKNFNKRFKYTNRAFANQYPFYEPSNENKRKSLIPRR